MLSRALLKCTTASLSPPRLLARTVGATLLTVPPMRLRPPPPAQLRSVQPNNKIPPRAGSMIVHTSLPTAVAGMLKNLVCDEDPLMPTRFITMLGDLGVLAIGRVYARGKERILWLPGAPEEKKGEIKESLRRMMEDFMEEHEEETSGCSDLVVYFDTKADIEPTVEAGETLNANFALIVFTKARAEGHELNPSVCQMLDDHERRQAMLEKAESTISEGYVFVAAGASRAGSSVAVDPTTPMGSRCSWPGHDPSTYSSPSVSLIRKIEEAVPASNSPVTAAASSASEPVWLTKASAALVSGAAAAAPAADEVQPVPESAKLPPPRPKAAKSPKGEDEDVDDFLRVKSSRSGQDAPKRLSRMAVDNHRPVGNDFEELTRPHAPSAQRISQLDGARPATTRSRLPAPSSALALNDHLKKIGAEICGEQPFETFGEQIEEGVEESIVDKVIKERHEEHYRYEKWSDARERWVGYQQDDRLLLDDQPVGSAHGYMSNGQKLEFLGSTDGCLYGVMARHVHGADHETNRKLVADKLIDWLVNAGEAAKFFGMTLRSWVRWDRVPPNITLYNWGELMAHLRDSFAYLEYTAADWLLLIAASHVFDPVLVFSARLGVAVRFVAADGGADVFSAFSEEPTAIHETNLGPRGYVDSAHLPAASETWIRLGLLENGHLVLCRSKELKSELMLRMCDTRDAELQAQLSVDVLHAAIFQGPSKAGKSTVMNALARKVLYDSTPPAPKKGEKKGARIQPELAVLGAPIKGSEIGRDMVSETLLVNSVVIKTDDDETPYLQLLDTPGMFDNRGPLIEVVNSISIAKCMKRFKTLRIVVMVRESALDATGDGFANTAETMGKLFLGGSASAKKNVLLWINPHKPEVDYGEDGIMDDIKKMTTARPEVRDFVRIIQGQYNSRKVVHVLEYEPETAQGTEREEILRALMERYPGRDPNAPVTKAVFDVDGLIDQLVALAPMRNPSDKCGLPLTDKAIAEIVRQASELQDYVSLRCELYDYTSLHRYLDTLQALCRHMQAGSSGMHNQMRGQNQFHLTYQASLTSVAEHLKATCGVEKMEALSRPIEQPMVLQTANFDSICFAMRAAAAAAVLEPHMSRALGTSWKDLSVEACCKIVCTHVQAASEATCTLLTDHFITGASGLPAAYRVFGEQTKLVLTKLMQVKEHFMHAASIADTASASFSAIATQAGKQLSLLLETLLKAVETQTKAAADHIARGLSEAQLAASQHLSSLTDAPGDVERTPMSSSVAVAAPEANASPYDAAASALDVIKCAEGSLVGLMEELQGVYEASRSHAISVVEQQSQAVLALIEEQTADEVSGEALEQVLWSLLFLLHARSSSLRGHCASASESASLDRLDSCYEKPVKVVVKWHADLTKGVLEAAKKGNESFVRNLSDHRSQVELSTELAKLAAVERIEAKQRAVVPFAQWGLLVTNASDVNRRIEVALNSFGASVEAHLKDHSNTICNASLDVVESYDYKEHTKDLSILRSAQWCDAILQSPIIEGTILGVWGVFEAHMKRLAQGEDGAMTLLRKGKHKEARTLLVQIHAMVSLVSGEHAEGVDAAHRVKELHDEVAVRPSALIARPVSACCCAPLPPHLLLPQLTVLPRAFADGRQRRDR